MCAPALLVVAAAFAAEAAAAAAAASPAPTPLARSPKSFRLAGPELNAFELDGAPFRFMAGSMHYWRNRRSEWKPKLQLMRDLGLNAVLTPTNWALHEPEEGRWEFGGQSDVTAFVRTAAEVGLLVVMRLGSYATAEMDLGGVPAWLIPKNITTIRSVDPVWQRYERRYFSKLLSLLTPHQYPAGPIVCAQLGDDSDVPILKVRRR